MDKSWVSIKNRVDRRFIKGVDDFLDLAFSQPGVSNRIRCPCKRCRNTEFATRKAVRAHIFDKGFLEQYCEVWDLHGESRQANNPIQGSEPMVEEPLVERIGYFRGKGYGKKAPSKRGRIEEVEINARINQAVEERVEQVVEEGVQQRIEQIKTEVNMNIESIIESRLESRMASILSSFAQSNAHSIPESLIQAFSMNNNVDGTRTSCSKEPNT